MSQEKKLNVPKTSRLVINPKGGAHETKKQKLQKRPDRKKKYRPVYEERLDQIFDESAWSDGWGTMKRGLALPLMVGALNMPMSNADTTDPDFSNVKKSVADVTQPVETKAQFPISKTDMEVIASTLILEAGGERHPDAMEAIMGVIINRGKNNPKNYAKVCLRKYQFSCHNNSTLQKDENKKRKELEKNIEKAKRHPKWNYAMDLVQATLKGYYTDMTDGATHYHVHKGNSKVTPYWTHPDFGGDNKKAEHTMSIGNHAFFKNVD
jgi:hypothetical protein